MRGHHVASHGYVWCNEMVEGELDNSCQHGPGPHRIKVCVVKVDKKDVWPHILKEYERGEARRRVPVGLASPVLVITVARRQNC